MNNVTLIGRLTADPELRTTSTGLSTTRFTLAVNGRQNQNGERQTNFISIVAWRSQAENLCKYIKKGGQIAVEGYIQTGSYTAQDGTKRYTTDVVANHIEFLGSRNDNVETNTNTNFDMSTSSNDETTSLAEDPYASMGDETVISEDDLPF